MISSIWYYNILYSILLLQIQYMIFEIALTNWLQLYGFVTEENKVGTKWAMTFQSFLITAVGWACIRIQYRKQVDIWLVSQGGFGLRCQIFHLRNKRYGYLTQIPPYLHVRCITIHFSDMKGLTLNRAQNIPPFPINVTPTKNDKLE